MPAETASRVRVTGTPVGLQLDHASRPKLTQMNVRIDTDVKRRAEEVLRLMGSSSTELVRAVYAKVAQGAQAYEETMAFLEGRAAPAEEASQAFRHADPLLEEAWSIGSTYFLSVGVDPNALPVDDRPWDEVYREGMEAHYREKGWVQ